MEDYQPVRTLPTEAWTHNSKVGAAMLGVLVLLGVYLVALSLKSFREYTYIGAGIPATNIITVEGEAKVFAAPDIATFTFSVVEKAPVPSEAQDRAAEKVNAVLAYLREEAGVAEADLKTITLSLMPQYRYEEVVCVRAPCPGPRQVPDGFEARQTVEIKVREVSRAGELIAGVSGRDVGEVSGLSFTFDDEDVLKNEARTQAIAEATQKAETLASQLGVDLVRIVSFHEEGMPQPFYARDMIQEQALALGAANVAVPDIPVGENEIASRVSISFEIR